MSSLWCCPCFSGIGKGLQASQRELLPASDSLGPLPLARRGACPEEEELDASASPSSNRSRKGVAVRRASEAEDGSAGLLNGFETIPEVQTIQVQPENMAKYSLPQEALAYVPDASGIVNRFPNGDSERMIFCNTSLTNQELAWLNACREEASRQKKAFLPSLTVAAGRYLGDSKGDCKAALESMQRGQDWRLNFFKNGPIIDSDIMEDMKHGVMYFCGRDCGMRPALVMRPARTPQEFCNEQGAARFSRLFLFCMEYFMRYMIVPGKIENVVVIVDLAGMTYSKVPPMSTLWELKAVMSQQNAGRVYRFYVTNLPWVLRAVSGAVSGAMTERQKQKLSLGIDNATLAKDFAPHQLETDLGGTRPVETTFLPFPLPPGPFKAGSSGPRKDAVPDLHHVLSPAGARGRLWDPSRSHKDNTRLGFASDAPDILKRWNLESLLEDTSQRDAEEGNGADIEVVSSKPHTHSLDLQADWTDGVREADVKLDGFAVQPKCFWACTPLCEVRCHVAR